MNEILEQVINRRDTWRGQHNFLQYSGDPANSDCHGADTLSSGYSTLDAALCQGGGDLWEPSCWHVGDSDVHHLQLSHVWQNLRRRPTHNDPSKPWVTRLLSNLGADVSKSTRI